MCIRDRNLPDWIEKESLPAERVLYMHMWRIQPGCFLMAGLANMGASGYHVSVSVTNQ